MKSERGPAGPDELPEASSGGKLPSGAGAGSVGSVASGPPLLSDGLEVESVDAGVSVVLGAPFPSFTKSGSSTSPMYVPSSPAGVPGVAGVPDGPEQMSPPSSLPKDTPKAP